MSSIDPGRPSRRTSRPGAAWAMAAAASLLSAVACGSPHPTVTPTLTPTPTPTAVSQLYAYPGNPLFAAAARFKAHGQQAEAADLQALARTPSGVWAAGQPGEMRTVREVTQAAAKEHAIPVIVAYDLPDRDACGRFSALAGPSASGYKRWIRQLAAAIGTGDDIVILEPDGLPDIVRGCLSQPQGAERYELLQYAMEHLGALPHAQVYLDAGNPGMFQDPAPLAGPLRKAGMRYGRGFSANVSNFQWTNVVVSWSQRLEHDLGGNIGVVIDTSRNGRGPYTGSETPQWCNPPGRAVGPAPTFDPGPAGIDAYLWIKDPGASDGSCNGGPPAGKYWPRYAISLEQDR